MNPLNVPPIYFMKLGYSVMNIVSITLPMSAVTDSAKTATFARSLARPS